MANDIDFGILNQVSPTLQVAGATQAAIADMLNRQQKERQMMMQNQQANRQADIQQQAVNQQGEYQQGQLANAMRGQDIQNEQFGQSLSLDQQKLLETQRVNDMDNQIKQGQLANAAEGNAIDRMFKSGQLQLSQDELTLKQEQMQNQMAMKQAMAQAAQGGLPAIRQLLLEQGNIKDAMDIDRTQSTIQKNFYAGQKSLLEIQDMQEQRESAQKASWLKPNVQGLAAMPDGEERDKRIMQVAQDSDVKYGTDFISSGASPHNILTAMTATVAGNDKDLIKAIKTLGPAAAPLVEGFFGKEVNAAGLPGGGTNINIDQRTQSKLLEPAVAKISAADTAMQAYEKRANISQQILTNYDQAVANGINPGTFAPAQQSLANLTDSLGLTKDKSSPGQVIKALQVQGAMSLRVAGTGSMSDKEQAWYLDATSGLQWASREGVQRVADFDKLQLQRAQEQRDFLVNWVQMNGTDAGAAQAWNKFTNENKVVDSKGNIDWNNVSGSLAYVKKYDQAKAIEEAKEGRAGIYTPPPVSQSNFKNVDLSKITDNQYNEAVQRLEAMRRARENGPQ